MARSESDIKRLKKLINTLEDETSFHLKCFRNRIRYLMTLSLALDVDRKELKKIFEEIKSIEFILKIWEQKAWEDLLPRNLKCGACGRKCAKFHKGLCRDCDERNEEAYAEQLEQGIRERMGSED